MIKVNQKIMSFLSKRSIGIFLAGFLIGLLVLETVIFRRVEHADFIPSTQQKIVTICADKPATSNEYSRELPLEVSSLKMSANIKTEIHRDMYSLGNISAYQKDEEYWKRAEHYNIDDYGTPIEEHIFSIDNMKSLTKKERVLKFKERGIKTILYYHAAYGASTYGFNYAETSKQGQLPYIMKGCKRRDCFCTDRKNFIDLEDFDAILFYSRAISRGDLPKVRRPNQIYILWEVESPAYLMGFSPMAWPNIFNWTHTFRRDSDLWEPWGLMNQAKPYPKDVDILIEERKSDTSAAEQKTKAIAWFVTNCNAVSGRDRYARELQKYIPVDIYGGCGPFKCDRSQSQKCWDDVVKNYHFYFSAENSLCKDYITEKFFNPLKYNIIPISYGGGQDTNDYSFAPKRSFINAFDYKSPADLAKVLKKLMSNKKEYVSYFWWKPYFNIWLGRWKKAHCEICDKLHAKEPAKFYPDMQDWWVSQGRCRPPYR